MQARFKKAGRYAHVNEAAREPFEVSEEDAAGEGKLITDLSELSAKTYSELGYCELVAVGDEVAVTEEKETETEDNSDDVNNKSKKGQRRRGNRG